MSSNKSKTLKIIAIALCVVLSIIAVAGAGAALYLGALNNGWFDKTIVENDDSVTDENVQSAGEMYVSESTGNGIMLTSVKLLAEEYEEYGISTASVDSAYTLTASYNSGASNPKFTWASSNTTAVTVTPSSSTISCVVTCNSAFSTAVTITCTAKDDSSVKATCTVGYYKKISKIGFTFYDENYEDTNFTNVVTWSSAGSTVTWTFDSSEGISTKSSVSAWYTTPTYSSYTVNDTFTFNIILNSYVTGSTVASYSTYREMLAGITGVSSSLSSDSFKTSVYNKLISYYNSSSPAAYFTVQATGKNADVTYSFYFYLIINPVDFA